MVYSNINTSIFYKENLGLNANDKGHSSPEYNLELFGEDLNITLGKLNTIYADKNVVFYPIYIAYISNRHKRKHIQIGVYEIEADKSLSVIDDDGDVDTERLNDPLLYSIVNDEFIKKIKKGTITEDNSAESSDKKKDTVEKVKNETEEDRVIKVKIPDSKKSEQINLAEKELESGAFDEDSSIVPPALLEEETMEDANNIKREYKEKAKSSWIAKFMKNNHFAIHEVESNGDCFFATVRDAFKQIGQITTVKRLRAIVAQEITDDMFQERRSLYLSLHGDVQNIENEMKQIKKNLNTIYASRIERAKMENDKPTLVNLEKERNSEKAKYAELQSQKNSTQELINETIGNFAPIDSLEKFREYIQTPSYWADSWAIGVIERRLNVKIIILSHRSYQERSFDNIMECGELDKQIQEKGKFTPSHYIMVSFSGNHFKLVTYKDKRIFKFHEIPFYIKNLIINKCLERAAGPFYVISDFKDMIKTKFGKDPPERDVEDALHRELFNPETLLIFGIKSSKNAKPGNMQGEKVNKNEMKNFLTLDRNKEWRRKLDDEYETQFNLDGHKWLSVEHYYQGSKFLNGFPDFYLQFSLDSESDISKSVDTAIDAGGSIGKRKGVILRPKNVVIDPTFYGDRSASVRENALYAKFSQNEDLKQMILSTRDARLAHFIRGDEPDTDFMLMEVRRKIAFEKSKK